MTSSLELPLLAFSIAGAPEEVLQFSGLQKFEITSQTGKIRYHLSVGLELVSRRQFLAYSCNCPSFKLRILSDARKVGVNISFGDRRAYLLLEPWEKTHVFRCKHLLRIIEERKR